MKKIAILASGEGTNAEAIARHFAGSADIEVAIMICNRRDAGVYARMERLGIPCRYYGKEEWSGPAAGDKVTRELLDAGVDLVVLAGFLAIIPQRMLDAFPRAIINIHPSLLPKYGGRGMWGHHVHEAVLASGDTESGITIHYVTADVDGGDIIEQVKCSVLPDDTPDTLAARIHPLEHEAFPRVIEQLLKQ